MLEIVTYVLIYVDDITIAGSPQWQRSSVATQGVITILLMFFGLEQFGALDYFLSIEVKSTVNGSLLLTQSKYLTELLREVDMDSAKGISTPLPSKLKLCKYAFFFLWLLKAVYVVRFLIRKKKSSSILF